MEYSKESKLLAIRDVIKTEDSRINYLRGLMRIAECDKNKSSAEADYIYKIAKILGASYSEIWQAEEQKENEDSIGINFKKKKKKSLFLMQALYMCWLDNDYSNAEREEILKIGNDLGFELTEIETIESWIKRGIVWMRDGAELIGLE